MLGGGFGAALAFLVGYAFARTAAALVALAAVGTFVAMLCHALAPPNEVLHVTANMNLFGWLVGTLLAARVRAVEWLHAQETA